MRLVVPGDRLGHVHRDESTPSPPTAQPGAEPDPEPDLRPDPMLWPGWSGQVGAALLTLGSIDAAEPADLVRLALNTWTVINCGTKIARRLWHQRRTRARPPSPPDDPSDTYVI